MPHAAIKIQAGRSEDDKQRLADAVTKAITESLGVGDDAVSVTVTDVAAAAWMTDVYQPEIAAEQSRLYKHPGYGP